jgi:hypothetical protein
MTILGDGALREGESPMASLPINSGSIAESALPWWKRTGPITAIASILAVTVPATTTLWGLVQKDRELAVKKVDQDHDIAMREMEVKHHIQMEFLDRLRNDDRLRTLRLVEMTDTDEHMREWARSEKGVVEKSVKELEQKIAEQTTKIAFVEKALQEVQADKKAAVTGKASEIARLRADAVREKSELEALRIERSGPLIRTPPSPAVTATKNWEATSESECYDFNRVCTNGAARPDDMILCGSLTNTCLSMVKVGQTFKASYKDGTLTAQF